VLELAHLKEGSWKSVQVPLGPEVLADLLAAPSYMRRPWVTSAGALTLVSVRGLATGWLLLFDGEKTEIVRGAGDSFSGQHFLAQGKLWTLELPGTLFAKPL
jgi:hypothetical protein